MIQNDQRIVTSIWGKDIPSSFYINTFQKKNFLVLNLLDCNFTAVEKVFKPYLTTLKNFNEQDIETQRLKSLASMLGNILKSVISYEENVKKHFLIQNGLHWIADWAYKTRKC